MLDIRDHGGKFGGMGLVKDTKIAVARLSPPSLPAKKVNSYSYIQSSTGYTLNYDPISDVVIHSHYNSGSTPPCKIFNRSTAKIIKDISPATGFSGAFLYRPALGRIYANFNSSGSLSIKSIADSGNAIIVSIPSRFIGKIIKHTDSYVIYWYNGELLKLDISTMTVTVVAVFGSNASIVTVAGWDKVLIRDSSTGRIRFVTLEGSEVGSVVSQYPIGWLVYHAPTNTLKSVGSEYGTSGGHFFYTYNVETLALISKVRLSTYNNVSTGVGDVASYDPISGQVMGGIGDANGISYVALFVINLDGSLKIPDGLVTTGWIDIESFPYVRYRHTFCPTENGGYALDYFTENQYYNYLQRITMNQIWEG